MYVTDTSVNSGLHVSTLLNPDDSPPTRNSIPNTPLSARIPHSAQSGGSMLPSINQGFHEAGNRDSHASIDSRRSSVDSRMHQGFNSLYINNPTSPYESANTSQVSLAASLRRPNGGAPLSPLSGRSAMRSHPPPRVAPPIMPIGQRSAGSLNATAAEPTRGQPWAFPDTVQEERRGSESDSSAGGLSRTGSLAASSIRSSIFSNDSQIPGQRRFDDGRCSVESLVFMISADMVPQMQPHITTQCNIERYTACRTRVCHRRLLETIAGLQNYASVTNSPSENGVAR